MPNAKAFSPVKHGIVTTVVGPSGSGKSTLARSAVEHFADGQATRAFAILAPAAELAGYAGLDMDYEVLVDAEFDSVAHVQQGKAMVSKALTQVRQVLTDLEKRTDLRVLIFDTANATISTAVWNAVLASQGIARPQESRNTFSAYQIYPLWMKELLDKVDLLRYRKKLHVIYLWHQAMKELQGFGKMRKEVVDGKAAIRWDEAMQAEVFGQAFAPAIPRYSDLFFFSEPVVEKGVLRCRLVAMPDEIRLPKTRLPDVMKRFQAMPEVPNDFPTLLTIVEQCYAGGSDAANKA